MKTPETPQEIRIRITKEELEAIFVIAGKINTRELGRGHIINWNSFIAKLKRFYK